MKTIKVSEKIEKISKIAWENSIIEAINDIDGNSTYFWMNEKPIETEIGHSNLPVVTNKYEQKHKKCRFELVDERKYQPFRGFISNDLAEKIVEILGTNKIDLEEV